MLRVIQEHQDQIAEICRRYNVKRLELFGSAARDKFQSGQSDVDFLVEFVAYDVPTIADQWFGLQEDLEAVLGCKVDLTSLRTAKNPHFLQSINQGKVTLYAA